MIPNIPAGLRELGNQLRKLKELEEWAKLARQEARPDVPPSFRPSNHVEEDICLNYAAFLSTNLDIREALNDPTLVIPARKRQQWQRRLGQLEQELRVIHPAPAKAL